MTATQTQTHTQTHRYVSRHILRELGKKRVISIWYFTQTEVYNSLE